MELIEVKLIQANSRDKIEVAKLKRILEFRWPFFLAPSCPSSLTARCAPLPFLFASGSAFVGPPRPAPDISLQVPSLFGALPKEVERQALFRPHRQESAQEAQDLLAQTAPAPPADAGAEKGPPGLGESVEIQAG